MPNKALVLPQPKSRLAGLVRRHPWIFIVIFALEIAWWYTLGGIIDDFIQMYRILRELEQIKRERDRAFLEHYGLANPRMEHLINRRLLLIKSKHQRP